MFGLMRVSTHNAIVEDMQEESRVLNAEIDAQRNAYHELDNVLMNERSARAEAERELNSLQAKYKDLQDEFETYKMEQTNLTAKAEPKKAPRKKPTVTKEQIEKAVKATSKTSKAGLKVKKAEV